MTSVVGYGYGAQQTVTGSLTANVAIPAATPTVAFAIPLNVGTWLVSATLLIQPANAFRADAQIQMGTAIGTIAGLSAGESLTGNGATGQQVLLQAVVVVTTPGTLEVIVESGAAATILSATGAYAFPGASGYTALFLG